MKKTIQICIPKGRKLIEGFGLSLLGLILNSQDNDKYTFTISIKEQPITSNVYDKSKFEKIAKSRNELVVDAINNKVDYVFFLDDDTVFPFDAVEKMFNHDKDFVSGICFQKKLPYFPTHFTSKYRRDKDGMIHQKYYHIIDYEDTLMEVEGVGLFCALIKTSVFEKLREPYFSSPELDITSEIGEDLSFSRRCWESDIKIFVDTTIKCGHIDGDIMVTEDDFLRNKEIARELNEKKYQI